jgi:hypothetical protein
MITKIKIIYYSIILNAAYTVYNRLNVKYDLTAKVMDTNNLPNGVRDQLIERRRELKAQLASVEARIIITNQTLDIIKCF